MIGDRIKMLRTSQGLTQTAFAKRLFVTPAAVSQWEKNITRPDTERLMKISKEFSVPLDFFSDDPDAKQYSESELIKEQLILKLTQPKTIEAKIISGGIDKMPQEDRERALDMMKLMFREYSDYFERKEADDDDRIYEMV